MRGEGEWGKWEMAASKSAQLPKNQTVRHRQLDPTCHRHKSHSNGKANAKTKQPDRTVRNKTEADPTVKKTGARGSQNIRLMDSNFVFIPLNNCW